MRWASVAFMLLMIVLFFSIIFNFPWVYNKIKEKNEY